MGGNSYIFISKSLYSENELSMYGFICCKALYIEGKLSTTILSLSVHIGKQFHLFMSPSVKDARPYHWMP